MSKRPQFYFCVIFLLVIYGCSKPKVKTENAVIQIDSSVSTADSLIQKIKSDYTLVQTDSLIVVRNNLTNEIDTVLVDEYESSVESESEEGLSESYSFSSKHEVVFLVGPYLSYDYSYEGSGGAHPAYGSFYRTIDIPTKRQVSLDSLFAPDVIFHALLNDTIIVRSMTNKSPQNLYELISSLDGECAIDFSGLLISFAIISVDSRNVDIEFGLTHGCEVARGNFTTITIHLPVSNVLNQYVSN
jgi:hypothetical protein